MRTPEQKIAHAKGLEAAAKVLRKEAFAERRLPPVWKMGMRVRFLHDMEWFCDEGSTGVIVGLREDYRGKPAAEYQIFYTNLTGEEHPTFWTTPSDVEWIPEDEDPA